MLPPDPSDESVDRCVSAVEEAEAVNLFPDRGSRPDLTSCCVPRVCVCGRASASKAAPIEVGANEPQTEVVFHPPGGDGVAACSGLPSLVPRPRIPGPAGTGQEWEGDTIEDRLIQM